MGTGMVMLLLFPGLWALPLEELAFADPVRAGALVPAGAKVEILADGLDFGEGPAAGPDGAIYFSDIPSGPKPGRILRYEPATGRLAVFRADSGKSNGLAFDGQGRLAACEGADHGGRRIARYTGDGPAQTLADRYDGKRFNAPNDLCIDQQGRIWFTDPKYRGDEPRELDHKSVYRIDPDGLVHLVLTQPRIQKPNGVAVSPDAKTLYVADTNDETVKLPDGNVIPGNMQLVAFEVRPDGGLGKKRLWEDFAPEKGVDGMTVDPEGNLFAAVRSPSRPGIRIYSPQGKAIGHIPTPQVPTNCTFGCGPDSAHLYITMDHCLGRIRLNRKDGG